MTGLVAAAAVGLAVAVLVGGPTPPRVRRIRLALASAAGPSASRNGTAAQAGPSGGAATPAPAPPRAGRPIISVVTTVVAVVAGAALAGAVVGPAGVVGVVGIVPVARWLRHRRVREIARRRRSAAVAEACLVIGSELAAGGSTRRAMQAAAQEWPELFGPAAGRLSMGGRPAPALRAAAEQPGAEAMTAVAAAWEVAEESGARAAVVLRVVADTVRDEAAVRHEAEAQLATVRTTARMLAALPLITLVVFSGGLEPVWFLLRNPYGVACLAGASVLLALGLAWVGVVRREATRSAWRR